MIEKWWLELRNKFSSVFLDEYIIMPDHLHGIIIINPVGDDLRVVPELSEDKHTGLSLPEIIQWFKTMTMNEFIKCVKEKGYPAFDKKLWQRSYYDRIIRNEKELNDIREYIQDNPLKWELEKFSIENLKF